MFEYGQRVCSQCSVSANASSGNDFLGISSGSILLPYPVAMELEAPATFRAAPLRIFILGSQDKSRSVTNFSYTPY